MAVSGGSDVYSPTNICGACAAYVHQHSENLFVQRVYKPRVFTLAALQSPLIDLHSSKVPVKDVVRDKCNRNVAAAWRLWLTVPAKQRPRISHLLAGLQ
jgi:hypothetical protein